MLKINVSQVKDPENGDSVIFDITKNEKGLLIGSELFDGDIARVRENHLHIIWHGKSYHVEIVDFDKNAKSLHLLIDGSSYFTTARDRLDLLLEKMGIQDGSSQKLNNIKAPMPGLIHSVAVSVGDQINKGDQLLVLVAMKMENVIKAPGSGIIKSLRISAGEIVEKNQVLLEFQ